MAVFASLVDQNQSTVKLWKKDFVESIYDVQFFVIPGSFLRIYADATSAVLAHEPDRLLEFIGTNLFVTLG